MSLALQERFEANPDRLLADLAKGKTAAYSKSKEIGYFSYDADRNLTLDKAQLVLSALVYPLNV